MLSSLKNFFWGKGGFFDMGDRYPVLDEHFQSSIAGLYIIGDIAGTPDIKASLNAGYDVGRWIGAHSEKQNISPKYSVVIIGGGPAGISAAMELHKAGVKYILLERKEIMQAITAFEDVLPLYYPSTGDPHVRGDLWFGDTTAKELLERWIPQIQAKKLNIHTREEVKSLKKKGTFVITTAQGEYTSDFVILATGKLTFLKKLGVEEEVDPRIVYENAREKKYARKNILINGITTASIESALELSSANTVTITDPGAMAQDLSYDDLEKLMKPVRAGSIAVYEHSYIDRLEKDAAIIHRANPARPNDPPEEIALPNDLVFSFRGIDRALVDHLEIDHTMMRGAGVKMENSWDWKRYAWLGVALIASGIFYYEKKTLYDSLGFGTILGVIALAVGGFYCIRGILNGIDEWRIEGKIVGIKKRSIVEFLLGGIVAVLGLWAVQTRPFDIWARSLGAWYPAIYSVLVTTFGIKAIFRWHDSIQTKKYASLILFQVFFFWILPEFILRNWLSYTIVYAWPLVIAPHTISSYLDPSFDAGLFYFWWGTGITVIVLPVFVALTGKKYCSWVCGCGGLAETVGDSFRHYSPKGKKNIDREGSLYWVTGVALVLTIVVGAIKLLKLDATIGGIQLSEAFEKIYSWGVDWTLISFIPVALYPFFGGKIWCRYWCPTALYMHLMSKFFTKKNVGFFRIDSDKERCIACNMCTRYCEVGIDVMRFALKGQVLDNTNSSCIGCGVCISVCPTDTLWYGERKSGQLVQIAIPTGG